METLHIDPTKVSPEVELNPKEGVFFFKGNSMSEDAVGFYMPIIEWIKEYAKNPNRKTEVSFQFTYFNTASSKLIWEVMILLQEIYKKGHDVKINWIFQDEDEDMEEAGEIYAERMDIPINLIINEN